MSPCEQVLVDLIHDLAQPLGNIETSAYCLEQSIAPENLRAQQHLRMIQQQIEHATRMLAAAASDIGHARAEALVLTAASR